MEQTIDRLSELTDDILHYILKLSCINIFDVAKLGVLSKRWNRLCTTMPDLDIDVEDFYDSCLPGVPIDHALVQKFRSFISWVLIREGESGLVQFRLCCGNTFEELQILRWLCAVAERNVQKLDIAFVPEGGFTLPPFIAVNDSLKDLRLNLYNNVMQLPSVVRLNQLRLLSLERIQFSDSYVLQQLLSGCCSLDTLMLDLCELLSFGVLEFSSNHLEYLVVYTDTIHPINFQIKVSCPNLNTFDISAPASMHLILEDVSSLETAYIELYAGDFRDEPQVCQMIHRNLNALHNVKDLSLNLVVVDCLSYVIDELIRCPPSFPKMKSLTLELFTIHNHAQVMFLLLDQCPNLENLSITSAEFSVEEWSNEQWEVHHEGIVRWTSHPHLKTITFDEFSGSFHEMVLLIYLLNATSLKKLDIYGVPDSETPLVVYEIVLSLFPKASTEIVITFHDV